MMFDRMNYKNYLNYLSNYGYTLHLDIFDEYI